MRVFNKKNTVVGLLTAFAVVFAMPKFAVAHVIVTPNQAKIGQELVFSVSVPNEKSVPVTNVKLLIPKGVTEVTPTTIPDWTISPTGSDDNISALTWTGTIPVGQREDFSFGAQVPGSSTQLDWKAYQTYADGIVVHWDQKPAGSDDATGNAGPYSVTNVINDLSTSSSSMHMSGSSNANSLTLVLSIAALILSLGSLFIRRK